MGSAVLADDGVDVLDGGDVGGWVVWKGEGGGRGSGCHGELPEVLSSFW